MKDETRILNLDELFGQGQPISVMWNGTKHRLRRPDEMGPRDLVIYDRLNGMLNEITAPPSEQDGHLDEERARAWDRTLDEMLRLVGPSLLEIDPPLPFMAKVKVLEFYTSQVVGAAVDDGEKKAPSTGEMSSAG